MPIIIPSKNIYNKKNPKVRNNLLQAIEVNAKKVIDDRQYNIVVYRKTVDSPTNSVNISDINDREIASHYDTVIGSTTYFYRAISCAEIRNIKVWKGTIQVPVLLVNKYVSKLTLGKEGINYSLIGNVKKGTITATAKSPEVGMNVSISNEKKSQPTEYNENVTYFLPNLPLKNEVYYQSGAGSKTSLTSEVTLQEYEEKKNIEQIKTATPIKINGIDYLQFDVSILYSFEKVFYSWSGYHSIGTETYESTYPLTGNYEEYECSKIEISLYGNTIGIDLQDESIIYGDPNSPNIISIDGNELLQTENYLGEDTSIYALEWFGTTTLPEYKNGKETATILCSISDYYDHIGKIAISPESNHNIIPFPYINKSATIDGVTFTVNNTSGVIKAKGTAQSTQLGGAVFYLMSNYEFDRPTTLFLSGCPEGGIGRQTYSIQIQTKVMENGVVDEDRWFFDYGNGVKCPNVIYIKMIRLVAFNNYTLPANFEFRPMLVYGAFAQEFQKSLPMTFDVYDEVIPRVLNSNGNDAPMSTYADGSAKVFKVLGVRVRYDGVTMQELILQEK